MLSLNKKGMEMKLIIKIAALALAFVIIGGLFSMIFAKTKGRGSEELCHTFNAIVLRGGLSQAKTLGLLPNACRVLDVNDIPEGKYTQDKEGAMNNIADLAGKCWWMFLEGVEEHTVLDKDIFKFKKKRCFICYTFDLSKKVSFNSGDLDNFFDATVYTVRDTSDKCAPLGGGSCANECQGEFSREAESKKCEAGEKCCVATNRNDECVNKGGRCLPSCIGEYTAEYPKWECDKNRCCVKSGNFYTYGDYIRRFRGPGAFGIDAGINFNQTGIYAVVFTEDTSIVTDVDTADAILITELSKVSEKCTIESGAP